MIAGEVLYCDGIFILTCAWSLLTSLGREVGAGRTQNVRRYIN